MKEKALIMRENTIYRMKMDNCEISTPYLVCAYLPGKDCKIKIFIIYW